jgi:hypothetical protein
VKKLISSIIGILSVGLLTINSTVTAASNDHGQNEYPTSTVFFNIQDSSGDGHVALSYLNTFTGGDSSVSTTLYYSINNTTNPADWYLLPSTIDITPGSSEKIYLISRVDGHWGSTGTVSQPSILGNSASYTIAWDPEVQNGNSGKYLSTSTLNFTEAPIPGAVWLLGSGLMGLAGWRRARRK